MNPDALSTSSALFQLSYLTYQPTNFVLVTILDFWYNQCKFQNRFWQSLKNETCNRPLFGIIWNWIYRELNPDVLNTSSALFRLSYLTYQPINFLLVTILDFWCNQCKCQNTGNTADTYVPVHIPVVPE